MVRLLLASLALPLAGCGWLVSLDGLAGGPDAGAGDGPEPCPLDLSSNPRHCGACGHSCLGGLCANSRCRPFTVAANQGAPLGIDVSAGHVYWVNRNPPGLMQWNKDGSGERALATPTDQLDDPFDIAVDASEIFVYWSELKNARIYRKQIAGGTKVPVGLGGPGQAAFLALDGTQVYVSDHRAAFGSIATDKVLYSGSEMITGLAVREGTLYWGVRETARILAGPVSGAPTGNVLVELGGATPMGVAVDADSVYWIEDGRLIRRAPRSGGAAVTLYESPQRFDESDLAVDATALYWTESATAGPGFVRRLAK